MTTIMRPLSLSELLDRTFSLYRNHFGMFVGIPALPYLALLISQLGIFLLRPMKLTHTRAVVTGVVAAQTRYNLLLILIALLVSACSHAATIGATSSLCLDRQTGIRAAYRDVQKRMLPFLLIAIALASVVGFSILVALVPGIVLMTYQRTAGILVLGGSIVASIGLWVALLCRWGLTGTLVVLENKGLWAATKRSGQLTKGHRGRVFVLYVLILVLIYAVRILFLLLSVGILTAITHRGGTPSSLRLAVAFSAFSNYVSGCLVGPLMAIAFTLMYYDQRVRMEAFDLEIMVSSLTGEAEPLAPEAAQ